jgi:two-component system chemotaxis response regulator CheB
MPSANILLESVARSYGPQAAGIVLTGMGSDGTLGLSLMREAGAFTAAQDEASSVVFGMPKAAIAAGAACVVQSLPQIAQTLISLTTQE